MVKHIGSAANDESVKELKQQADYFISTNNPTMSLFPGQTPPRIVDLDKVSLVKISHLFALEFLSFFYQRNGFDRLEGPEADLLKHLCLMRIVKPSSKIRAINLLAKHFNIRYPKNAVYNLLPNIAKLQPLVEKQAVNYARKHLGFDFSVVFYDLTTLYFETFGEDELRKCGFSKDNKTNQPQVLVALVVNQDGYPIKCQMFEGNTFEGHTLIPVLRKLKKDHHIDSLTVVADAAMLSFGNITQLEQAGLSYIVAARMAGLPKHLLEEVSQELNKVEGRYSDRQTKYGRLICDYSNKRASKNRSDRKKQLEKARQYLANPSKRTRLKFVKAVGPSSYRLNQELVDKLEKLDGIKGYYTNLGLKHSPPAGIVSAYKQLWRVEQSFRIAKSDLLARPIFHRKKEHIQAHLTIVFASLCITKVIELASGWSIQVVKEAIWEVVDILLLDQISGQTFTKRQVLPEEDQVIQWFKKLKSDAY